MLELIKFSKGKNAYYSGMLLLLPQMLAMKAGLISKSKAKERMLKHFFANTPLIVFNQRCKKFADEVLPSLIRPDAMTMINQHLSNNDEVVVVSASAENWVSDWCKKNGLKFIATRLKTSDGKITGMLDGANCNGEEKVNRIKLLFDPAEYSSVFCYGDTECDKPMLKIATDPFYRLFNQ